MAIEQQLQSFEPFDDADYRLKRSVEHFYERTRVGAVFYFLGILVSALYDDLYQNHLFEVLGAASFFIATWLLRYFFQSPTGNEDKLRQWRSQCWSILIVNVSAWSVCFCWVLLDTELVGAMYTMVMCTVAFSAACAFQYAINRIPCILATSTFFLPAIGTIVVYRPDLYPLAIALAVFNLYLYVSILKAHREYHQQIDLEIELLTTQQDLHTMSMTDALTGVANRRLYTQFLRQSYNRSIRHKEPLSLIILDLDHFKKINDTYGHQIGDEVLRRTARVLQRTCQRRVDLIARIGGEEFAIILPKTNLEEAGNVVAKLQKAMNKCNEMTAADLPPVTFSAGVGELDLERDGTPDELFIRVDQAGYLAKQNGRNRVEIAAPAEDH